MRAKLVALIIMALVAAFAWVRYPLSFHHVTTGSMVKPPVSPEVKLANLGSLPSVSPRELQSLINQGLVYGIALRSAHKTVLFLARTPNAPSHLVVAHWPPLRFAAIAVLSNPLTTFSGNWNRDQKEIHWLRLSSHLILGT
ncbi:hypothetical protein [Sulfobacillus thermosulfidooxidans]|uniref:hypothetical protein n=1 Tax=Sulfobacillus thermosulfidooxidans TaxID=28034 RepID=UPI00048D56BA|nr:hypothetical protein [Sulfobacillus thermosulfidooxidans]